MEAFPSELMQKCDTSKNSVSTFGDVVTELIKERKQLADCATTHQSLMDAIEKRLNDQSQ